MGHFGGSVNVGNFEDHWQYRGTVPVSRIIEGTKVSSSQNQEWGFCHWTAGCHGTNGFLRAVLRVANIPVIYTRKVGHATPYFPTEELYLSHGDDIYGGSFYIGINEIPPLDEEENPISFLQNITKPQYPAVDLLINKTTYDSWFSSNLPAEAIKNNIGRRKTELALKYLPNIWLVYYCRDVEEGKTLSTGTFYEKTNLYHIYSIMELEEMGLWNRIAEKVSLMGGWNAVRQLPCYPTDP
jgi:hypothetical protein